MQVIVTYSADKVDDFIELADAIEAEFPELQVDGVEAGEDHNFSIRKETGEVITDSNSSKFLSAHSILDKLKEAGFR